MTSRVKRTPRPQDSISFCSCGKRSTIESSTDWRNRLDAAIGQFSRMRSCSCGRKWRTVELRESDLQELRRRAHLWTMSEGTWA